MLGSVGVILGAVIIKFTGLLIVDPIISLLIVALIIFNAFKLVKESLHILMEGTPPNIRLEEVISLLENMEGVIDAHDVHIWSIGTTNYALTAHLFVNKKADINETIKKANLLLEQNYNIRHTTLQVETAHTAQTCETKRCQV